MRIAFVLASEFIIKRGNSDKFPPIKKKSENNLKKKPHLINKNKSYWKTKYTSK